MKKYITLLIITFALVSFSILQGLDEVVASFKTGNAAQVARYFDNTVDISLPEKSSSYNKSQAEAVLREFFAGNAVKSFNLIHKGNKAGSEYFIGSLVTKGKTYRTTIFMKQKGDKQYLQEIRIENE
jgi:hypothetical protein